MNDTQDTNHSPPLTPASVAIELYGAVAAGDIEKARRHLTDDAVLHVPGDNPGSGDHVGPDAIVGFVTRATSGPGASEAIELLDVLEGGRHAAVYCRITGHAPDGRTLDNHTVHVLEIEDGRVTDIWFHNRDQAAVDAFWAVAS